VTRAATAPVAGTTTQDQTLAKNTNNTAAALIHVAPRHPDGGLG
jgi:hypothetical protein